MFKIIRYVELAILIAVASCYEVAAHQRNFVWKTEATLWADCVSRSPSRARPHNSLGVALERLGKYDEAITQYSEALRIDPGHVNAHNNLGGYYLDRGLVDKAIFKRPCGWRQTMPEPIIIWPWPMEARESIVSPQRR